MARPSSKPYSFPICAPSVIICGLSAYQTKSRTCPYTAALSLTPEWLRQPTFVFVATFIGKKIPQNQSMPPFKSTRQSERVLDLIDGIFEQFGIDPLTH